MKVEFKIVPSKGFTLKRISPDGGVIGYLYSGIVNKNKISLIPAFNLMDESLADYVHTILWRMNRKLEEIV